MLHRSAELKLALARDAGPVLATVAACETALRADKKLIFCGNGGSAADAQHLAAELVIRWRGSVPRASWPALPLCDLAIVVPETDTARMQECHITLGHAILTLLEDRLVG